MICNVKINPVSFLYRRRLQVGPRGGLPAIWFQDTPFGVEKLKLTPIYRSMKNINF
jgi:hypothetical protein